MGRNIYFTDEEIKALRDASTEWCDMMANGDEMTVESVDTRLNEGLGSALHKLYKGCYGEEVYEKYRRTNRRNIT